MSANQNEGGAGQGDSPEREQADSPTPSCLSTQSDEVISVPMEEPHSSKVKRPGSPAPSCQSIKSDQSMEPPIMFSTKQPQSSKVKRPGSPAPSCQSMESDQSMEPPIMFSTEQPQSSKVKRPGSPAPSFQSMKSDQSMEPPIMFSTKQPQSSKVKRPGSPAPSCLSMKSDQSMEPPIMFSTKQPQSSKVKRPGSPAPSFQSMESDQSMEPPIMFSTKQPQSSKVKRPGSPAPSCLSMKSDQSMEPPIMFSTKQPQSSKVKRPGSPAPSCLSMKSDQSMEPPIMFSTKQPQSSKVKRPGSPAPSFQSMESDQSMEPPIMFSTKQPQSSKVKRPGSPAPSFQSMEPPIMFSTKQPQRVRERKRSQSSTLSDVLMKTDQSMDQSMDQSPISSSQRDTHRCAVCEEAVSDPVSASCGHWLCRQCITQPGPSGHYACPQCGKRYRQGLSSRMAVKKKFKKAMKENLASTSEGNDDQKSSLNSIYTTLWITTGMSEWNSSEHEIGQIESSLCRLTLAEPSVSLNDIFKSSPGQVKPIRTVVTLGIAGIGKSFAVKKFSLDWAEGEANEDIDFVFILALREVNLIKEKTSLHGLLTEFHPELRDLDAEDYRTSNIVVILDGLDESRLKLDFQNSKIVRSVSEVTSLDVLLTNLIQRNLLPSARLWITSRPAAAYQIPPECVDMVTEIRGFSAPQKEEYFRKRFKDQDFARKILSHIKSSRKLHSMCLIPVFCWILAEVFCETCGVEKIPEIPQTLTELVAHFVLIQTKRRNRKYDKEAEKDTEKLLKSYREFLLKLGKLAFKHLERNSIIFYEEDLKECGIDYAEASVYSGFCTAILKEEKVLHQKKIFCFVHLIIQEFFAALYVYDCFMSKNTKELRLLLGQNPRFFQKDQTLLDLLKKTVDKVLESENGHLDLFLCFLLGLTCESNQKNLPGLLARPDPSSETTKKLLTYLKTIRRKDHSPFRCINLFQCMAEMKDQKVKEEIEEYLKTGDSSGKELTPMQCSALAYILLVSAENVEVFDLRNYKTSAAGRRRLIPAVRCSKKAILADCKVDGNWVESLAFGLTFSKSPLVELDLTNSDLRDSGVKLLSAGLTNSNCKLQILRLSGCLVTEEGCGYLVSALTSNPSHLRELDLSYNHPGDSGVKQLSKLRDDTSYSLQTLNVEHGGSQRMKPGYKKYACDLTLDPNTAHRNLSLTEDNRKVTWVKEALPHLDHPQRFDSHPQVLCREGLTGRSYLEVEGCDPFSIGLTYKGISRKGDGESCRLGYNDESWGMVCSETGCFALHGTKRISISSLCHRSSRVGVYLDWPGGTLSFYRVSSDTLTLLHTFHSTFTEPLYPGFEVQPLSPMSLCQL